MISPTLPIGPEARIRTSQTVVRPDPIASTELFFRLDRSVGDEPMMRLAATAINDDFPTPTLPMNTTGCDGSARNALLLSIALIHSTAESAEFGSAWLTVSITLRS